MTIFYLNIFHILFLWCIITPVFSLTWSFRNHSNADLLLKKHLLLLIFSRDVTLLYETPPPPPNRQNEALLPHQLFLADCIK